MNKTQWPELVGKTQQDAVAVITAERPDLHVEVLESGSMMTMDFREDRLRLMVNEEGKVASVPHVG